MSLYGVIQDITYLGKVRRQDAGDRLIGVLTRTESNPSREPATHLRDVADISMTFR